MYICITKNDRIRYGMGGGAAVPSGGGGGGGGARAPEKSDVCDSPEVGLGSASHYGQSTYQESTN